MDTDQYVSGKYKKLTSTEKEKQYLKDHPKEVPLTIKTISVPGDTNNSPRRTTWYAGLTDSKVNSKSIKEDDESKRKSDDVLHLRASNSNSLNPKLGSRALNLSAPQLSLFATDKPERELRKATTPPGSPHTSGLVKLREKKNKGGNIASRSNKAITVYGDQYHAATAKKTRPRSTLFSNSVMRKPRTSISVAPLCLVDTLDNKKLRTAFLDFLESEYSSENLCFWLSCQKFRKIKGEEQRSREGQYIYDQYISSTAPYQINIDHVTRRQITLILTGCDPVPAEVFDNAQRYVFSIMENDSYPRFLNSHFYKDAISKKNTFETVIANILPGSWNTSAATSPTKQQTKLKANSNNNNNNNNAVKVPVDVETTKNNQTILGRFSFRMKKNYEVKQKKADRSSNPELSSQTFFNFEVSVA